MKVTRQLLAFCFLIICGWTHALASNAEPDSNNMGYSTHNDIYFIDNELVESFYGSLGAVSGEVIARKPGPKNLPMLQIKLSELEKTIWIASTIEVEEKQLDIGDKIDVLGFFDETKNETQFVSKITDDSAYLLGFCYRVKPIYQPLYNPHLLKRCLDWETGKLDLKVPHNSVQK